MLQTKVQGTSFRERAVNDKNNYLSLNTVFVCWAIAAPELFGKNSWVEWVTSNLWIVGKQNPHSTQELGFIYDSNWLDTGEDY